jgi:hypothetical protein
MHSQLVEKVVLLQKPRSVNMWKQCIYYVISTLPCLQLVISLSTEIVVYFTLWTLSMACGIHNVNNDLFASWCPLRGVALGLFITLSVVFVLLCVCGIIWCMYDSAYNAVTKQSNNYRV